MPGQNVSLVEKSPVEQYDLNAVSANPGSRSISRQFGLGSNRSVWCLIQNGAEIIKIPKMSIVSAIIQNGQFIFLSIEAMISKLIHIRQYLSYETYTRNVI